LPELDKKFYGKIIFAMAVIVRVPTPLRRLTNGQGEVQVEALTIREAVEKLESLYPGFKERLLDENGELRKFVNIYLNDEDIRFLKGIDTELKDGDVLSIVPAIAGGF
jgi:molybdopterin synthase sulfur carrier subunit